MGENNSDNMEINYKRTRLEEDIVTLKWCAYNREFTPNTKDNRFKTWTEKGITVMWMLLKDGKETYVLERDDLFRYLQIWHFINKIGGE